MAKDRTSVAGGGSAIYCIGIFGAWVYFWQLANGFGAHLWAIVQGIFWPAWLVYNLLGALHA